MDACYKLECLEAVCHAVLTTKILGGAYELNEKRVKRRKPCFERRKMVNMLFIGLDVGTTGCKAAVYNETGKSLGKAYRELDVLHPQPGYSEQDPETVWACVLEVLAESVNAAKRNGAKAEEFAAICTSILGEEIMPVDKKFRPLRTSILGMDYRAEQETDDLCRALGKRWIYDTTGFPPHPMGSLPTIMWMRKHQPELLEKNI